MKITILLDNLSSNSVARAYHRAKVLQRHYQVELVGPVLGNGIYEPFRDELPYRPVCPGKVRFPEYFGTLLRLVKQVRGKVVYALQPRVSSFGVALLVKLSRHLPVVLEMYDSDLEPYVDQSLPRKLYTSIRYAHTPSIKSYGVLLSRLLPFADERIVGSEFLQNRYGGVRLYHGVDCDVFDPTGFDSVELKEKWGLTGKKVILFGGISLPHKGVEDLIAAVKMLEEPSLRIVVMGEGSYVTSLQRIAGDCLVRIGVQPYSLLPELLSFADMVVLPQRRTALAQAQVPGKLFDAMAMAKPIITTAVSDLPEILSGCGWSVEPDDPAVLAEAIEVVLRNPDAAAEMGWRARKKCQEKYSWDAMESILIPIFQRYAS